MAARLRNVPAVASFSRSAVPVLTSDAIPALVLVDGAERRGLPGDEYGEGGTPPYRMYPAVQMIVRTDSDAEVATALTALRAQVIRALARNAVSDVFDLTLGGLVLWLTSHELRPVETPEGAERTLPEASQLLILAAARPEAEMDPWLQAGY